MSDDLQEPDGAEENSTESLFEAPPMGEQERMVEAMLFAASEPVSLRDMARNRAEREGYTFKIIGKEDLGPVLPDLKEISDAWLESKQGKEKSFSLGGFEVGYLSNFDHAVLLDPDGKIIAFANLFQSGNKHELSLDLMRYAPDGPSFAMDALFAEMMLWGAAQGFQWCSLGAAGFDPTGSDGLSSRFSFGNRASMALLQRRSTSYAASLILGASCS